MIEKEQYPNILEWIKDELVKREEYEMCKTIMDLLKYFKNKENVRLKRNSKSLVDSK